MKKKIFVFDSHPVQYRVPIWQCIETKQQQCLKVVYGSDCSVRGHADEGFGIIVSWDEPMLEGYENSILNCEKGKPLTGWGSLTGKGISKIFSQEKPDVVFLTGLNYRYDWVAYWEGIKRNIPIWLRCETQDMATNRSKWKTAIRFVFYSIAYLKVDNFFYIGELNKQHYLQHLVPFKKLIAARYCTKNRVEQFNEDEKSNIRFATRNAVNILNDKIVIGFSGKLITKKHPNILFESVQYLSDEMKRRVVFYFIGSGELEIPLKRQASDLLNKYGIRSFFLGFINQSEIAPHYLAMDIMVLPSRKMGETWGLVANEALQAGCGVIVSNAVGCSADFASLERFKVFSEANAMQLADHIAYLSKFERSFNWANHFLSDYSIESTANAILRCKH